MCGRFAFNFTWPELHALLQLATPIDEAPGFLTPRYNAAPTQDLPVVLIRDGQRVPTQMRWGLVPSWAKDRAIGNRLINARSETAHEKPSFRAAFKRRRCLIPASGFYEWKRPEKPGDRKLPHFIRLRSRSPFAMAGLWEHHERPGLRPLTTFTILTTTPNKLLSDLHDRMPVIIPPEWFEPWLDPTTEQPEGWDQLLEPFPADEMETYIVSTRVNSPATDDPGCMAPVDSEESTRGSTGGLFGPD